MIRHRKFEAKKRRLARRLANKKLRIARRKARRNAKRAKKALKRAKKALRRAGRKIRRIRRNLRRKEEKAERHKRKLAKEQRKLAKERKIGTPQSQKAQLAKVNRCQAIVSNLINQIKKRQDKIREALKRKQNAKKFVKTCVKAQKKSY